jgi:hypothetical protein
MILPIQQCLDNRSRNIWQYAPNVLVDIRDTTVMLRGSIGMVFQVKVGSEDHKRYEGTISRITRNSMYEQNIIR